MSDYSGQPPEGGPYGAPGQPGPYGQPESYGAPAYGGLPPANSSRATTSLVLGILSLVCLGLLSGIPAMIIGRNATKEIDASHGAIGGRGMATAGFVTGLIGTLLSVLGLVAVIGVLALGGAVTVGDSCTESTNGGAFSDC